MNKLTGLITATAALSMAGVVTADSMSAFHDWENGGTILGSYSNGGNLSVENYDWGGERGNVLALTEDPPVGTPQGFVGWITGLQHGDVIDASFLGLGDGEEFSKVRIWASYTTGDDISDFGGSAGGNNVYSTAEWTLLSDTWTFDVGNAGDHTGLVIQARVYTYSGQVMNTAFVDDLNISVTGDDLSGVEIHLPGPIPAPGALALLGLAGLAGRRRRRH